MKQNIRYTLISLLALCTLGSCRDDVEMIRDTCKLPWHNVT